MGCIIDFHDIQNYVLKQSGVIVAACGCFDIFHIGHLEYLKAAKSLGDTLFVGINSDESIFINKGKRPIFGIEDRLQVISALECVDYVFEFYEKSFDKSLCMIQPVFFARGVDASEKGYPEEETALQNGIKTVNVGHSKRSSSRVLRRYFEYS